MSPGSRNQIITAILLLVIVFSIGNLIFNIERLDIGDEIFVETDYEAEASTSVASSGSAAATLRYMLIGLMAIAFAITIGGIIWGTANRDKDFMKSVLAAVVGGVIALAVLSAAFYYTQYEKPEYEYNEALDDDAFEWVNGTSNGTGSLPSGEEPGGMDVTLSLLVIGACIAFVILLIYAVGHISYLRKDDYSGIDVDAVSDDVSQTIQRAMDDMTSGTDVRSSIMRCYLDMCRLAARHGISDEENLTPREFEAMMSHTLPVSDDKLHELILIFEEARYSDHELSEIMRTRAMGALGDIRKDLKLEEERRAKEMGEEPGGPEMANEGGEKAGQ